MTFQHSTAKHSRPTDQLRNGDVHDFHDKLMQLLICMLVGFILECAGFQLNESRRVYRARFSSVSEKDIMKAMSNLVEPDKDESLAVDARQEIDLKAGVAFTRFQTSFFQGNLGILILDYGPCQTPTLGFCVQRYLQITTFKPEKFWAVHPYIIHNGYELKLDWERNKLFDSDVAEMFQKLIMEDGIVEVTSISEKQECKARPSGLNTVNLLKNSFNIVVYIVCLEE
ncbi:DNA topoisomerase 3-beta [Camellia lanceoleosa]|uniref:DNA topoisomerase 3-beta n=1 Tax=Camellia lanceoleosa TaxID=1840588 RepID=A0ACC0H8N5_9ERIC|nr:DNA topoisomerase 3-beta [Camellia lanceoleosa]